MARDAILNVPVLKEEGGVLFLSQENSGFEEFYLEVRGKEGWLYDDDAVCKLPDTDAADKNRKLWEIRKKSTERFFAYIKKKQKSVSLLDIGCGNGWFAARLAHIHPEISVMGIDVNKTELNVAARVFAASQVQWMYGNIFENIFRENSFDIITMNASFQYFKGNSVIPVLLKYLKKGGELHILDTPFYSEKNIEAARSATADYYKKINVPEMSDFYFHHTYNEIRSFQPEFYYLPSGWKRIFSKMTFRSYVPFPWVVIRMSEHD